VRTFELVTHDIGIMVGFAIAATHPERGEPWGGIDAPLPASDPGSDPAGSGHVATSASVVTTWTAWSPAASASISTLLERAFPGRERFDEAKRQHYAALYAQPGAMRAGLCQFCRSGRMRPTTKHSLRRAKLQMPVLPWVAKPIRPHDWRGASVCRRYVEDVIIRIAGTGSRRSRPAATTKLVVRLPASPFVS